MTDIERWTTKHGGGIQWSVFQDANMPHENRIEMNGRNVCLTARFKVTVDAELELSLEAMWPNLRVRADNENIGLRRTITPELTIRVNGKPHIIKRVERIRFPGTLEIRYSSIDGLSIWRHIFPSLTFPIIIDSWWFVLRDSLKPMILEIDRFARTDTEQGVGNEYIIEQTGDALFPTSFLDKGSARYDRKYYAYANGQIILDAATKEEKKERESFIHKVSDYAGVMPLLIEMFGESDIDDHPRNRLLTPDNAINVAYEFAKLRVAEGILTAHPSLTDEAISNGHHLFASGHELSNAQHPLASQTSVDAQDDTSRLHTLLKLYIAGETQQATAQLIAYTRPRLLGEQVPYPVAMNTQGELSQTPYVSALYCRVITEGLFGILPTGFRSFRCVPRLPGDWPEMRLTNVRAFGGSFDLRVGREIEAIRLIVSVNGQVVFDRSQADGGAFDVTLPTQ